MKGPWWSAILVGLALGVGLLLRLEALKVEFWFDEIWSWQQVHGIHTPQEVFTHLRHDNNHHLNSLVLFCWPEHLPWAWYRLHSLLAGVTAILLAAWALWPRRSEANKTADAVFASFLVAVNYWLVLCSAEARGYALAVVFALLGFRALREVLAGAGWGWWSLFWAAVVLGFLSHLTFMHCYVGMIVWSLRHYARHRTRPGQELVQLIRLHAVPGVLVGLFYLISVRGMELGGGPEASTWSVVGRLLALGFGLDAEAWGPPALNVLYLIPVGLILAVGLWQISQDGSEEWVFFLVAIVVSPTLFLLFRRTNFLFERYFLISFVFLLLVFARVLGFLWRWQGLGKYSGPAGALIFAGLTISCSLSNDLGFLRSGRGQFFEALAYVESQDAGPAITIAGDSDFRIEKFCDFYAPYLQNDKAVFYLRKENLPPGGAHWLIVHRLDARYPAEETESDGKGNVYKLEKSYPSTGFVCWGWFVYRNAVKQAR